MWAASRIDDRDDAHPLLYVLASIGIAVVYLALSELELTLYQLGVVSSLIWAPSGIGFALILLYGVRWLPGVALGTYLAVLAHQDAATAGLVMITEVLQILAGYYLLRRVLRFRPQLDRVRDVSAFVAVDLVISLLGGALGAGFLSVTDHVASHSYLLMWSSWWTVDVSGDLILAPALLTWLSRSRAPQPPRVAEVVALVLTGLFVSSMIFTSWAPSWLPTVKTSYLLPIMLWAGVRFGPRGAASASLLAGMTAIVVHSLGLGTFPGPRDLYAFIAISSITTLVLSALVQERVRAVERRGAVQVGALDAIITIDRNGCVRELNPAAEKLFGVREADAIGRDLAPIVIPPRLRDAYYRGLRGYLEGRGGSIVGSRYRTTAWRASDGTEFPVEIAVTRVPDDQEILLTGFVRDTTAEQAAEAARREASANLERIVEERTAALRESLHEGDTRMREIHHRVKNNLQVISSLLNLQLSSAESDVARDALLDSQNRIAAMALVHQLLYESKSIARIDFGDYLRKLVDRLATAHNVAPERISIEVRAPAIPVDIDRAIPCGLIVNELVTNALAHAFPDLRRGHVQVDLERQEQLLVLTVSDDGRGLPHDMRFEEPRTFGLQIVNTLTHQIDGTMARVPRAGTAIRITFPADDRSSTEA